MVGAENCEPASQPATKRHLQTGNRVALSSNRRRMNGAAGGHCSTRRGRQADRQADGQTDRRTAFVPLFAYRSVCVAAHASSVACCCVHQRATVSVFFVLQPYSSAFMFIRTSINADRSVARTNSRSPSVSAFCGSGHRAVAHKRASDEI